MAPLGPNQDAKTTNGNGGLLNETAPLEKHPAPLTAANMFSRLAGIGVLLLIVVVAFLYLGGWFSPQKLTPARFVDEFERVNGIQSGFRRNHAKGVCVRGFFDSNGQGARLSKAVVCALRVGTSFPDPSAQRHGVRRNAGDAYDPGIPFLSRIRRPFWSCSVSHADRARRIARPHGAVASPRALTSSKRHSSWRAAARRRCRR